MTRAFSFIHHGARFFLQRHRVFELNTNDTGLLPDPPDDREKYLYATRYTNYLLAASVASFVCISISSVNFILHHPGLEILGGFVLLNIVYYVVSMAVNFRTHDFDLRGHRRRVRAWHPDVYPSVDVFLPTAGEDPAVIENTWKGVRAMAARYIGKVNVYALDDGADLRVAALARRFGFRYEVRPDRGYFKKAGNLRHGFKVSAARFIVIFDADFTPRADFLDETLPYFNDPNIGIVQTPQYFSVDIRQSWLERGAGAVQELFYRFSQVSRESNDASICVGSNAVYRREALKATGGTALIEHSEDVHTGFNLRLNHWSVTYIPVILAKGLCPASMRSFFKQQYRWCLGSMSLLSSDKFWRQKLGLRSRLSYVSGFMYYIHTALMALYTPVVPLILLVFLPKDIVLVNYGLILPAIIFTQVVYPLWHRSIYGIEAWATRLVYGWAHLFAIFDHLRRRPMGWQPTGSKAGKDYRYQLFRTLQLVFNVVPGAVWVGLSAYYLITTRSLAYTLILASGLYYFAVSTKVAFSRDRP